MCGIAGWVDWKDDLTRQGPIVARMADTLSHRGPDGHGQWLSPHAALAHRRLIVIDPLGGGQPMIFQESGRTYVLTYNGELYNFRELRHELESKGHTFRTQSDTEVLLHAYIEWERECTIHLNGIFAFGVWDDQKQQLFLARDHLGVKPLFYAQRDSAILFGSELKALLAHPLVKAEVDVQGLAELFAFRRSPGAAVYRGIYELRPGHVAVCDESGIHITRYWSLHSAPHHEDLPTTVEHIKALLEDTVTHQLFADVPVVAMLSGGLDSSGLTALAARDFEREGKCLHTYSIDFADSAHHFQSNIMRPDLDEPWAKKVSEYTGTQHHTIKVDTPELIENLLIPMYAHDLPSIGQMEASLFLLFKAMKQEATVAISGESADEIFGGYPWFYNEAVIQTPTFPWLASLGGYRNAATSYLSTNLLQKVQPVQYTQQQYSTAIAEVSHLEGEDAQTARMREIFYLNLTYYLPMMLDRKDAMSMATGFEVRVPYCDYRLVEYVWNIPWEMKSIDHIEKGILRRALTGLLPDDARQRRKSAYPVTQNPTYLEALRIWTLDILNDSNAAVQPFINTQVVRDMAEGKIPGMPDDAILFLFERVIQTNAWLKDYHVTVSL